MMLVLLPADFLQSIGCPCPHYFMQIVLISENADEKVSLRDSHEIGNSLIHLNIASNYIMILSLYF